MGLYSTHLRPRLHNASLNDRVTGEVRARVCEGLVGDVLEIGYGSGLNQPYLPPEVTSVRAVEPSAVALRLAAQRRAASSAPVLGAGADAQALPMPDDHFDAALSTWTLCGIEDPAAALREVSRGLKPGRVPHFVEHGLAPDARVVRWQHRGNRLNQLVAGCVLDRDVRTLIETSGLRL